MLKLYLDIIMGRQLDRLMPFWQPANILHSVLIFMLLWQINIVVVVVRQTKLVQREGTVATAIVVGYTGRDC